MLGLETVLRIARDYDPARLVADLETAEAYAFRELPATYHNGAWSGIALVAQHGKADDLGYGPGPYEPTEILARCPYFAEIVASLPSAKHLVRLLALEPGGRVHEHYDPDQGLDHGVVRLHVPIVTDPRARLVIAGHAWHFGVGETWYADFSYPHYVVNPSPARRVHLVIELVVDEFVRSILPADYVRIRWARRIRRGILCKASEVRGALRAAARTLVRWLLPQSLEARVVRLLSR